MKLPRVQSDYYPLGGGLDLLTPAIAMPPGKVISSQNYEPEIGGGYRRIDGFERYDGQVAPSSKSYWIANVTLSGTVAVNDTITGVTSGATGYVLATLTNQLVLGALTGTFINFETIRVAANVGTMGQVTANSASSSTAHADYILLAANLQRTAIGQVPGSGRIRGVKYYNGALYAFRDNAAATAGDLYKATASGWVKVNFGSEIQFSGAVGEVFAGDTITGLTSGATALVIKPLLRTGTWTVNGVGTLIISTITGTWQSGEAIRVGGITKATSASLATSITRLPGGALECANANFTGSTATTKMYGCDGVNKAFEFDGTNYIPIRTGMTADMPTHICIHKFQLFLSFLGSVQLSGIGNPYSWSVVTGAAEIATGETVTGFLVQTGTSLGATLAIFTEGQTYILYGSSTANFVMTSSIKDVGAFAFTAQPIGNDALMLTKRGIQRLLTTLSYGDFDSASVSHLIQPFITFRRGLQTCSTTLRTKNQYRVYFSDGLGLVVGLTGDKINGITPIDYGLPVRCICTDTDTTGTEVTWFGSDSGFVYQESKGTSFDGAVITSWIRLPFNNLKSPRVRKRYRSAVLELVVDGYSKIDVTYDLGYGVIDVAQGIAALDQQLLASGGFWDQLTWDSFTWDTQVVGNPRMSLDGIEKNISLMFYSSRAQDSAHTIQGVTLMYTPLRIEH